LANQASIIDFNHWRDYWTK